MKLLAICLTMVLATACSPEEDDGKLPPPRQMPNTHFHFIPRAEFEDYTPDDWDITDVNEFFCVQHWHQGRYIVGGFGLIAMSMQDQTRRDEGIAFCVMCVMGMCGRSTTYPDSVFNYGAGNSSYSARDLEVLRILYDRRLTSLMTIDTVPPEVAADYSPEAYAYFEEIAFEIGYSDEVRLRKFTSSVFFQVYDAYNDADVATLSRAIDQIQAASALPVLEPLFEE